MLSDFLDVIMRQNNYFKIQSIKYRNYLTRFSIYFIFSCEAIIMGTISSYLPEIKDDIGLSDSMLGTAFLFIYLFMAISTPVTSFLLRYFGVRTTVIISTLLCCVSFPLIPTANSFGVLVGCFIFLGFFLGILDISMNNGVLLCEIVGGKPCMGSFHGLYSIVAALASLIGGGLRQANLEFSYTSIIYSLILASGTIALAPHIYNFKQEKYLLNFQASGNTIGDLLGTREESIDNNINALHLTPSSPITQVFKSNSKSIENYSSFDNNLYEDLIVPQQINSDPKKSPHSFSFKSFAKIMDKLIFISSIGFISSFCETFNTTWAVEFYDRYLFGSSDLVKSFGYSSFMISMGIGRLLCDSLRKKIGRTNIVFISGFLGIIGIILIVLSVEIAPNESDLPSTTRTSLSVIVASIGFSFTGMGVSTLVPIAFSTTGSLNNLNSSNRLQSKSIGSVNGSMYHSNEETIHTGSALAIVGFFSYIGGIISSPLTGLLNEGITLQYSTLLISLLFMALIFLSYKIPPEDPITD